MEIAAFLPASSALMTTSGPVTQSPPANTPGSPVSSVSGSAASVPHLVVSRPSLSPKAVTSGDWPMVAMAASQGITKLGVGNRLGSRPSAGIRRTKLHLLAHQAGDVAIRSGLERLRRNQKHQLDALALRILDLAPIRRHFRPGTAINDGDFAGSRRAAPCAPHPAQSFHRQSPAPSCLGLRASSRLTRRRKSRPPMTPGRSSPGMFSLRSTWAPIATKMAAIVFAQVRRS